MFNFDRSAIIKNTASSPVWMHFGAGNIFRGYIARLQQDLLEIGESESGIIAVETFDYDIIEKIYKPHDNIALLCTLNPDGMIDQKLIGSITHALRADNDASEINDIFRNPSLQIISLTITEKGYAIKDMSGGFLPVIEADINAGPDKAAHVMSRLAAGCYYRYTNGGGELALVSFDNCSNNGDLIKDGVMQIARAWQQRGFVDEGFIGYLGGGKISYPITMVDKITPRPSETVLKTLIEQGLEGMDIVITGKNTFIAPFVNAERPEYLVIEDDFPNGRPPLEKAGVLFADRHTVMQAEVMKVTTCLNPLHTALAIFGCLLNYETIADEMKDADLRRLAEIIGYDEGMKVVVDPKIICPKAFLDEVINVRLPNPFLMDMPQRITTDTSQKIPVRFGNTIKKYLKDETLFAASLEGIPLTIAAWLRYLLGVDDNLNPMTISPDPLLSEMQAMLAGITASEPKSYTGQLKGVLNSEMLFGVNLYDAGLGEKIEGMFVQMLSGVGAVRAVLRDNVRRDDY